MGVRGLATTVHSRPQLYAVNPVPEPIPTGAHLVFDFYCMLYKLYMIRPTESPHFATCRYSPTVYLPYISINLSPGQHTLITTPVQPYTHGKCPRRGPRTHRSRASALCHCAQKCTTQGNMCDRCTGWHGRGRCLALAGVAGTSAQ